jgi:riboflavin synthase
MFTGIIQATGFVAALSEKTDGLRIRIATRSLDLSDVKLGDSIAVNGVCLTVVDLPGDGFWADVSRETLANTRMGKLRIRSQVNLEKAMQADSRFGGHMVSGHVDGIGKVISREDAGRFTRLLVRAPKGLGKYIAKKGSVSIDGASLTVNEVSDSDFVLTIVPHTLKETVMADYREGSYVNIEVDIVARYLERLLDPALEATQDNSLEKSGQRSRKRPQYNNISEALLAENGFI